MHEAENALHSSAVSTGELSERVSNVLKSNVARNALLWRENLEGSLKMWAFGESRGKVFSAWQRGNFPHGNELASG